MKRFEDLAALPQGSRRMHGSNNETAEGKRVGRWAGGEEVSFNEGLRRLGVIKRSIYGLAAAQDSLMSE